MDPISIWIISVVVVVVAVAVAVLKLTNRDRKLRQRGKTEEQVVVASRASVWNSYGSYTFLVGLLFIFGAIAEYIDQSLTAKAVGLALLGLVIIAIAVRRLRKASDLQKFVDQN